MTKLEIRKELGKSTVLKKKEREILWKILLYSASKYSYFHNNAEFKI